MMMVLMVVVVVVLVVFVVAVQVDAEIERREWHVAQQQDRCAHIPAVQ